MNAAVEVSLSPSSPVARAANDPAPHGVSRARAVAANGLSCSPCWRWSFSPPAGATRRTGRPLARAM